MGKVLVSFALRQEGAPFARRLTRRAVRNGLVLGHIGTQEIAVCWLGVGVENLELFERTVAALRPHLIINSGFAGGIRSLLEAGDFVLAKNYSSPETLVGTSHVFSASGNLVSVTGIVGPETKARLRLQGNILAIDERMKLYQVYLSVESYKVLRMFFMRSILPDGCLSCGKSWPRGCVISLKSLSGNRPAMASIPALSLPRVGARVSIIVRLPRMLARFRTKSNRPRR